MDELGIVNAYIDGLPIVEIEKLFGVKRCSIYYYLKKNNIKPNRAKKLSPEAVKQLIDLYKSGEKLADINAKFKKHCDIIIYKHIRGNRIKYLDESQMKFIDENIGIMKQKDIADKLGISSAAITYYKKNKENYHV